MPTASQGDEGNEAPQLAITCTSATLTSERPPENGQPRKNEDSSIIMLDKGVVAVCDGAGGRGGGEVASSLAVSYLRSVVGDAGYLDAWSSEDELRGRLVLLMQGASAYVEQQAAQAGVAGALTTIKLAKLVPQADGTTKCYSLGVGDSRLLELMEPKAVGCVATPVGNSDDNLLKDLILTHNARASEDAVVEAQEIMAHYVHGQQTGGLTLNEVQFMQRLGLGAEVLKMAYNRRNEILGALGDKRKHTPNVTVTTYRPGTILILASDGVTDNTPPTEIAEIVRSNLGKAGVDLAAALVEGARDRCRSRNGKPDDMTAVVIRVEGNTKTDGSAKRAAPRPEAVTSIAGGNAGRIEDDHGVSAVERWLYTYIESLPPEGVRGSNDRVYPKPEIHDIARKVLSGELHPYAVTKAADLRRRMTAAVCRAHPGLAVAPNDSRLPKEERGYGLAIFAEAGFNLSEYTQLAAMIDLVYSLGGAVPDNDGREHKVNYSAPYLKSVIDTYRKMAEAGSGYNTQLARTLLYGIPKGWGFDEALQAVTGIRNPVESIIDAPERLHINALEQATPPVTGSRVRGLNYVVSAPTVYRPAA